jgi:hypothetical protein
VVPVPVFLCIGLCHDSSEQHKPDDKDIQSFCVGCIHYAVVYYRMAVSIGKRGCYSTGIGIDTATAVLVLSRPSDKRQGFLHIPDSKSD